MSINPWQVDSIQAFYFLKCPECNFTNREESDFQNHAVENHPLSIPFFEKYDFAIEEIGNFDNYNESNDPLTTVKEELLETYDDYKISEQTFLTENDMNIIKREEEFTGAENFLGNSNIKSEKKFLDSDLEFKHETPKKSLNKKNLKKTAKSAKKLRAENVNNGNTPNLVSYECSSCTSSFKTSKKLTHHVMSVHEGQMPFKCHICDESFSKSIKLRAHLTSAHEGEKHYKCSNCEDSFFSSSKLRWHVQSVHEEKKSHICSFCGRSFSQSSHLKGHIESVHEGKKPFQCPTCDYSSSKKAHIKNHISAVHERKISP